MSDTSKAVFLSYASQDAEAAKRICDALRGAGVEVWFDSEGGLEHGDEWDAKIRRQIKECVLFIAVISANTQAREEGYFRLEWELAAQRALSIASGVAFILPVVIDGTKEPEALVPDRFRTVQWTRLIGGVVPPEVLQRFLKLWSHRTGALKGVDPIRAQPATDSSPVAAAPAKSRSALMPALVALGVVAAAVGGWWLVRSAPVAPVVKTLAAVTPAVAVAPAVPSEARQLAAKAFALVRALEATREDYTLAEEYCQRAIKLDPDEAEAWAAFSQVNSAFNYRGWDTAPARREQARLAAERAMRLAPTSVNARMVQAGSWSAYNINRDEREKLLREILQEQPDNQEALRFLAVTVLPKPNGLEECLALNERSAALPDGDPLALFNNARYLWMRGRLTEGYATIQRALAQKSFPSALVLKMTMDIGRGDFTAANATFAQIPATALQEDRANLQAGLLHYHQGNAAAALQIWQSFPREYYSDFTYEGPKGLLVGRAYALDHRDVAAKIEWRAALQLVEKKIAATPNNPNPYLAQATLLAYLGEKPAAADALRTYEQLAGIKYGPDQSMTMPVAKVYVHLGRLDEVFAHPPVASLGVLSISPDFAALRADPRWEQLLSRVKGGSASAVAKPSAVAGPMADKMADKTADEKSVAVLAFANLSDDKANEYFSDGISEELLNVLAKVPGLKVSARTSAFYFKGKGVSVAEVARQLGVAYVVDGSVRKAGDKVRINAQLIKAADGFQVWSDTFTRDLKDIFAVQDEIAGLIARNLQLKLGAVNERASVRPEIYEMLLQARAFARNESTDGRKKAIAIYRRALAAEPRLAVAWAEMAHAYIALGRFGGLPIAEGMREARAAAQQALVLDPDQPAGLTALALVQRTADWDWRGAQQSIQRAMKLAPDDPGIMSNAAVLFFNVGRVDEAITLARQAVERDPLSVLAQFYLGVLLELNGQFEESLPHLRKAVELAPTADEYHTHVARSLISLNRLAEAATMVELEPNEAYRLVGQAQLRYAQGDRAAAKKSFGDLVTKYGEEIPGYVALTCAMLEDNEQAFAWLDRALARRDAAVVWVKTNWYLRPLRTDPRWPEFLRKLGLADEQLR